MVLEVVLSEITVQFGEIVGNLRVIYREFFVGWSAEGDLIKGYPGIVY